MNKKTILFLFLSLTMVGCTKEDFSDCPTGFLVTFEPDNPKHNLTREVQNLDLYFYAQSNDSLLKKLSYTRSELRSYDCAAHVPQDSVPAGEYRLLAVFNGGIDTRTDNYETFDKVHTRLNDTEIGGIKPAPVDPLVTLFSGETYLEIEAYPPVGEEIVFPVSLYKHNNLIRVNIVYDDEYELPAGSRVDIHIDGSNGRYHHSTRSCRSNESNDEGVYTIFRPWERYERLDPVEGNVSEIYISTVHMWHDSDLKVHFDEVAGTRSGEDPTKSYDFSLTDLLKDVDQAKIGGETVKNPYDTDDKLRFHDEYEIWIRVGKTSIATKVGLDDWAKVGDDQVEI